MNGHATHDPAPRRLALTPLLLPLLALLSWSGALAAQDAPPIPTGSAVVFGSVVAEGDGRPVASAGVDLLFASDSLRVAGTTTDPQGRFRLEDVPEGTFVLRLSSLGYGTVHTQAFEVAAAERRDLGELRVPVDALDVAPITVSVERTAVTYEADRTTYAVGVMPGAEGASVTETLRTIPQLEVGIDGQVRLRNSSVQIYINGRRAPMSGEALNLFLEQFPADYLQQIEVIDNPSARYDAEGTGGIVNLVTKEGVELGMSGSVFANAGTRGQYGVGARGTLQRGDWTFNGGGFGNLSDAENTSYDLRQNLFVDPAFLRQDGRSERSALASNVDLEMRWQPTERTSLEVEGRVTASGSDAEGLTVTTHLDDAQAVILTYDRSRASESRDLSWDLSSTFEREWGERDHELELQVSAQRGWGREDSREEIGDAFEEIDGVLIPAELTIEEEDEREDELGFEIDYARAWGEDGEIEIGYEAESSQNDSDRFLETLDDDTGGQPVVEARGYEERERSHSLYATFDRELTEDVGVELGLRAEWVELEFEVPDQGEWIGFGRDDLDWFPSANVSWRIDEDRRVRASWSRRVGRPGLSVLNPVNQSTDPLQRRVGNPDIEPQYSHSMTVNGSWSLDRGMLSFSPYWITTRNDWAPLTTVDEQGVSLRTYQNVASRDSYGATLGYHLRDREQRWGGSLNVSLAREVRNASNLGERYSGSSLRISSRANVDGRITEDLSAQGNFSYSPATDLPQGYQEARYRADLGLRYRFFDGRGSLRLALQDPFGLRETASRLRDVDYILVGRSVESSRSAQLSVSYTLGGGGRMRGGDRWRGRR